MKTNTNTPIGRMLLLYNNYWNLYNKQLLLGLGAVVAAIACYQTFIHLVNYDHLNSLHNNIGSNQAAFSFFFIIGYLLYCGHAFPVLRSKEKCMGYLMLPATTAEKFTSEWINRVLLFLILFPIVYWLSVNLVTGIFHAFNPEYTQYKFAFVLIFPQWMTGKDIILFLSIVLLIPNIAFTGATFFRNLPLVKTIIAVFLIIGFYVAYTYFVVDKLGLKEYSPRDNRVLFIHGPEGAKLWGIIAAVVVNIVLLTMGYFKIKEKEA